MSFLKKIFSFIEGDKPPATSSSIDLAQLEKIQLGRYTDVNKTKEQLTSWDKAKELLAEKNYLAAYKEFLNYVGDRRIQNVSFVESDGKLTFEIIQGSKVVKGVADAHKVEAEAQVASFSTPVVPVMRKLLNLNYTLRHGRFAIKDDTFYIKFSAPNVGMTMNKLYFALKEVATRADQQDDILTEEFASLQSVGTSHVEELSDEEKNIKVKYFKKWIQDTLDHVEKNNLPRLSGGTSYLLLDLVFKLDYLIAPEGSLLNTLEKIQDIYYRDSGNNTSDDFYYQEKNNGMLAEFKKLAEKPDEDIKKALYKVKATFGLVNASNLQKIGDFIDSQLKNVGWYYDNKHYEIEQAIYGYIAGYCCFFFGMYPVHYRLFRLFFNIVYPDYFEALGVKEKYWNADKTLNKVVIEREINMILKEEQKNYVKLSFKVNELKYTTLGDFSYSFLQEIKFMVI